MMVTFLILVGIIVILAAIIIWLAAEHRDAVRLIISTRTMIRQYDYTLNKAGKAPDGNDYNNIVREVLGRSYTNIHRR